MARASVSFMEAFLCLVRVPPGTMADDLIHALGPRELARDGVAFRGLQVS